MTLKVNKLFATIINALENAEKVLACAICLETSSELIETRCGHLFCYICIQKILRQSEKCCPVCKLVLTRRNISPGSQMKMCALLLLELVEAIHADTDIDMGVCLKMPCETRKSILLTKNSSKTIKPCHQIAQRGEKMTLNVDDFGVHKKRNKPLELRADEIVNKSGPSNDRLTHQSENGDLYVTNKSLCSFLTYKVNNDIVENQSNDDCQINGNHKKECKQKSRTGIDIAESRYNACDTMYHRQISNSTYKRTDTVSVHRNVTPEIATTATKLSAQTGNIAEISHNSDTKLVKLVDKNRDVSNILTNNNVLYNVDAVSDNGKTAFKAGWRPPANETNYMVPFEKVKFKKLGHLCKPNKKNVSFLYFGAIKERDPNSFTTCKPADISEALSTSHISNEIQNESSPMDKQGSKSRTMRKSDPSLHLSKPRTVETSTAIIRPDHSSDRTVEIGQRHENRHSLNACKTPLASRIQISSSPHSRSVNPYQSAKSGPEAFLISASSLPRHCRKSSTICLEQTALRHTSPRSPETPERSKEQTVLTYVSPKSPERSSAKKCTLALLFSVDRKRKRSESPNKYSDFLVDSHRKMQIMSTDKRLKKRPGVYKDQVCSTSTPFSRHDHSSDIAIPSYLPLPQLHDLNSSLRANITHKRCEIIPNVQKSLDCTFQVLISQPCSRESDTTAQSSKYRAPEKLDEIIPLENSMLDITAEELLLKQFEIDLFCKNKSVTEAQSNRSNDKQDALDEYEKSISDSSHIIDCTSIHIQQQRGVSITQMKDCEKLNIHADVIERTCKSACYKSVDNGSIADRNPCISTISKDHLIVPDRLEQHTRQLQVTLTGAQCNDVDTHKDSDTLILAELRPLNQSTPISKNQNIVNCSSPRSNGEFQEAPNLSTAHPNADENRKAITLEPLTRNFCILCSGLPLKQIDQVKRFSMIFHTKHTNTFNSDVTHIIVKTDDDSNTAYKTLKYLQGIVCRKWVLNINWILDSIEQQTILDEESYEVVDNMTMIPGPKRARLGASGPFEGFTILCVEPFINMSVPECEDLLRRTGANIVETFQDLAAEKSSLKVFLVQADYHENKIIDWHETTGAVPIAQEWIVECISQYRLVPFFPFLQELLPQDVFDLGFPVQTIEDNMVFVYE